MFPNDITGIYFLIDESDEIVYVGQSVDIGERVVKHAKAGTKSWSSYFFLPCSSSRIGEIEAYYILSLKPKYNTVIPKNSIFHRVPHVVSFRDRIYEYDPYVVGHVIHGSLQAEARLDPKYRKLLRKQEEKAIKDSDKYGPVIHKFM